MGLKCRSSHPCMSTYVSEQRVKTFITNQAQTDTLSYKHRQTRFIVLRPWGSVGSPFLRCWMAPFSQSGAFSLKIDRLLSLPILTRNSSLEIACFPLLSGGFNCILYLRTLSSRPRSPQRPWKAWEVLCIYQYQHTCVVNVFLTCVYQYQHVCVCLCLCVEGELCKFGWLKYVDPLNKWNTHTHTNVKKYPLCVRKFTQP